MNPPPSSDDPWLEAQLRHEALPPLPDAGFSLQVLAALPTRRPALAWRRLALYGVGTLAGLALAFHRGGSWPELIEACDQFVRTATDALTPSAVMWPSLVLAATIFGLAYIFVTETEEQTF
jgi:hypothetical protein